MPSCFHTAAQVCSGVGVACAEANSALAASTLKCLEGWFKLDWMCEPEGARYGSPGGVRQTQVGWAVQGLMSHPSLHSADPVPPPSADSGMCSFMSCKQEHQAEIAGLAAAKIPHLQAQLWQALLKSLEARDAPVMDAVAHVFEALLGECCPQSWSLLPVGSGTLDSNRWPDTLRPTRHCSFYGVCRPKNAGTPPSLIELNTAGRRSCTVRFLVPQR